MYEVALDQLRFKPPPLQSQKAGSGAKRHNHVMARRGNVFPAEIYVPITAWKIYPFKTQRHSFAVSIQKVKWQTANGSLI